jgi:MoaA/NifB/PqqE/SkfB family radical SAM enzyme
MSEPTLHPEFLKIVGEIKKMGLKIKICTNGDLHNDEFWNTLSFLLDDNDEIWFTICGCKQETHEYYRKNTNL